MFNYAVAIMLTCTDKSCVVARKLRDVACFFYAQCYLLLVLKGQGRYSTGLLGLT